MISYPTGIDRQTPAIRRVGAHRAASLLALAWFGGLAAPDLATAVLVSPNGTYYRPSPTTAASSTLPSCPKDVCASDDVADDYESALQSAIASLEPFTIRVGSSTEIAVEDLTVSFSCIDLRQGDVDDCEDEAWDDYQDALEAGQGKPGPWSDFAGAWTDYQDALDECREVLEDDYRGRSDVEVSGNLVSGQSEGSLTVTARLKLDLCRLQVCLTNIDYAYDMGGWVGFLGDLGSALGASPDLTLVDGNGDDYALGGGSASVCIPLSEVF